jgi:hAT family C-terminal dimerisation region
MPLRISATDDFDASTVPLRSRRDGVAQRDYAQMDDPWRRGRSRSASPAPENRRACRQRSPVSSESQETIAPSESASNVSRRIPDIMKRSWEKQPRTGARTRWSPVYEYYESINLVEEVYYKREDKAKKTPYEDVLRICMRCQEMGKTTQSTDSSRFGSTSNLWTHLKTTHNIYPNGKSDPASTTFQPTLSCYGVTTNKGADSSVAMALDDAIIEWIIDTQQPFEIVNNEKWRQMWKIALNRPCPINSHQTLRRRIEQEFSKCQLHMYEQLKNTAESISLSLDVWKAPNGKHILAVICHWTTEDFEDRQLVIHFGHLKGSHTGENMAKEIQEVLKNFNLEQKLLAICGDNASNNPTLCRHIHRLLKQKFVDSTKKLAIPGNEQRKLMLFKGDESFIRCLAHVLNVVAKSMLKIFKAGSHKEAKTIIQQMSIDKRDTFRMDETPQSAIARLRLIVLWILASEQRVDKYMEYASVSLDYDVDTRWNALLKMLEIAIRERCAINRMCAECKPLEPLALTEAEWMFLGDIFQVMLPLYEKTLLVSQIAPTIFQSTEIYWDLDDYFDEIIEMQGTWASIDAKIQEAVRAGRQTLEAYTKKMDAETIIPYAAAVLDPRVKTHLLKTHLQNGAINVIDNLRAHFNEISPMEEKICLHRPNPIPSTTKPTSFVGRVRGLQAPSNRQQMLRDIQQKHYSTVASSEADEIEDWLESAPIQEPVPDYMTAEQDISWLMGWWRMNRFKYPRMAKIARRYLSVPASEVGVERLFSRGRDLLGLRRYALQPATIKMLTVLKAFQSNKHWLQSIIDIREEVVEPDVEIEIEVISK